MPIPFLPEFRFEAPGFLWLAPPALALLFVAGRRGPGAAIAFPSLVHFGGGGRVARGLPGGVTLWCYCLALVAGVTALARPQKIREIEIATGEGVEIAIAIDVSFSMSIEDYDLDGTTVNRLEAAKSVIKQFIDGRPSDRIGLIIFSGRPHTLGPLTMDHDWLLATIDREIHFDHNIAQATAIGTAIATSAKRLSDREAASKIVVLITDGDQNVPGLSPEDAAALASTLGIKVYPIAIGTPGRHFMPRGRQWLQQSFDLETLERVAGITGAKAYQGKDTATLRRIFKEIDALEKSEIERRILTEAEEFFQWPATAAAALLALGMAWSLSFGRVAPE